MPYIPYIQIINVFDSPPLATTLNLYAFSPISLYDLKTNNCCLLVPTFLFYHQIAFTYHEEVSGQLAIYGTVISSRRHRRFDFTYQPVEHLSGYQETEQFYANSWPTLP